MANTNTINDKKAYDIIIVGGGMVGATLACALGNSAMKVAVIEAHQSDFNWSENSHDIRVSALTHASQHIFENLGVWPSMQHDGVAAYNKMNVWDASGQGQIHFNSVEVGQVDLGHIVENRVIQKAVQKKLADFENIDLLMPLQLQSMTLSESGAELITSDGQHLSAELVVGADGANSWVRKQADIALNSWAYHQTAVVCNVKTSESHQDACWQQFMPEGPLAFLPLADGQSSIVWSTTEEKSQALVNMDEKSFNQELQMTFGSSLGRIQLTSERGAFPLRLRHAKHYVQEHLALVGDAAHTVHPLAGQGVNLGLLDAVVLAEEVIRAHEKKRALGALSTLRRYERRRKVDNIAMLAAMDAFKRLFSNDITPLKLLRNAGLNLADKFTPFKNLMIKRAMGYSGTGLNEPLPHLARMNLDL
ncbi:MAG: UbiH/UbiF/VisC/COQ6 family ubiquinone biosynthesis hydroxylase [gamma proteobacterium symbiont of Bathyaustriella thionipta]|nr:UbiH/UbiF/VisC/COQ6 family ubiquinone biosynthesis hydroxylase [gamma proteobacterium symbiont of Bathyaustriella thionipta]MCU7948465.1 UbiH/UbiF/VisC/COQ6 family ubiquinone biosynthesis hydroxylase [gamma proteobacterium symbiont of Bathyaustriella thionipta]MCU7952461.1 UbiH/UbiF/VisC/COQ6 family ubiquinone biosynthesis hydroxylase [gamma proteobacterium symbiont of Bathyaustriella thionipta]MCU7955387.1 UbiH/UbiF/VisC/COQ6 family ubiquinone biosynthesis hydroxylase [gamma proteobacterium 